MNTHRKTSGWLWFDRWFHPEVPANRLGAFRVLVCAVALYDVLLYSGGVLFDAANESSGEPGRPWSPIYLFSLLGLQPIGLPAAQTVLVVTITALVCGILGLCSRLACAVGAVAFYYCTGLAYSFGKPHHDKVALAFAIAALPFARVGLAVSVDAVLAAMWRAWTGRGNDTGPALTVGGMALRLTQFSIAIGYCGAGLGKLLIGGLDWFNGYTLQGIMLGHDGAWSRAFAANVGFCQLQSVGVVLIQATFPLVLFWPALRWFYLPAALCFHLMTWQTMDTGPYMRLWLLLFAFVPMEVIPATLRRWLTTGGLCAVVTAVAIVLFLWLVLGVANEAVPTWAVLATAASLSSSFVLGLLPAARVELCVDQQQRGQRVARVLVQGLDWGRRVVSGNEPAANAGFAVRTAAGREWHGFPACAALGLRLPGLMLLWPFFAVVVWCARPARPA